MKLAAAKHSVGAAVKRVGRSRFMIFLSVLGPGIIAANADNDAGGITTWSVAGATYGYSLLWALLLLTPILGMTQEMGARMGAVTGKGLAALIRERFSLRVTAFAMLALLIANFSTTVSEYAGIASAFGLAHVPSWASVPATALAVWALVTRGNYRKIERVFLAMSALYVTYIISGILAGPDWGQALRGTVLPKVEWSAPWTLMVVAAIGTTITPWGQFFIQAYVADKHIGVREYIYTKVEVFIGALVTNGVDFFIVVACAATLYRDGILIETAADAAQALAPLAGRLAGFLFGLGLLNVSILGAAILPLATAYAVCEAFGFESGLDHSFREAPVFNGILTAFILVPALATVVPSIPLVQLILIAQSINGVLLPIILFYVLRIINDPSVMGDHVNGRVYNAVAWAFSLLLVALSAVLVVTSLPLPFL